MNLPSNWFQLQFQKRLAKPEFEEEERAWDYVQKNGCDPSVLLACLELYCRHRAAERYAEPSDSYIPEFLEDNAAIVANAQRLATDVEQVASRMEEMNNRPEFFREAIWWQEYNPKVLDYLRSYASWLKETARKIQGPFTLRDQPGQLLNYASGYIEKMTGARIAESISVLAKLIRVGYATVKINEDVDEDSLGRTVRRARRRLKKLRMKKKK